MERYHVRSVILAENILVPSLPVFVTENHFPQVLSFNIYYIHVISVIRTLHDIDIYIFTIALWQKQDLIDGELKIRPSYTLCTFHAVDFQSRIAHWKTWRPYCRPERWAKTALVQFRKRQVFLAKAEWLGQEDTHSGTGQSELLLVDEMDFSWLWPSKGSPDLRRL